MDVPRRFVLSRNGVVNTRPNKVMRTLRFTLFISSVHPLRLKSLSTRFISSGDDPYYKECAARQKGLGADLLGLSPGKQSTHCRPELTLGAEMKRSQNPKIEKTQ